MQQYRPLITFAIIFVAVCWIELTALALLLARIFRRPSRAPRVFKTCMSAAAVLIIGCVLWAYFVEPMRLEVTHIDLSSAKLHGKIRVVQISDLHCESKPHLEGRVVSAINELKPDLILFTGDCINSAQGAAIFKNTLSQLHAAMGKFAITGNYDYEFLPGIDRFSGTGFTVLDSNTARLIKNGDRINITGIDFAKLSIWPRAAEKIGHEGYTIFLCHPPDIVDDLSYCNVDLYLAGHTHGGQIRLPLLGGIYPYYTVFGKCYESGLFTVGKTKLYVNRGIGMAGRFPRLRFLCPPEITVFDIGPENMTK
jgi:predicted MPP superfamily phosphohydrolase